MNRPLLIVTTLAAMLLAVGGGLLVLMYLGWPLVVGGGGRTRAISPDEQVVFAAQVGVLGALTLGLGSGLLVQLRRAWADKRAAPFRLPGAVAVGAALAFPLTIGAGLAILHASLTVQGYGFPLIHLLVVVLPALLALGLVAASGRRAMVPALLVLPGGLGGRNSQTDRSGGLLTRAVIGPPTARRVLGALTWGMTGGAGIAILFQLLAIVLGVVVVIVFLLLTGQGDLVRELTNGGGGSSLDLNDPALVGSLLTNPLVILGAIFAIGVVVPLIEEPSKGLAVILLRRQLASERDGFLYGAAAGAGFGMLENIFYSTSSLDGWGTTASLRFGTILMHSLASGLFGLAVYRAMRLRQRGGWRTALAAMGLHGLWNSTQIVIIALGAAVGGPTDPLELLQAGHILGWLWLGWMIALTVFAAVQLLLIPRRVAGVAGLLPASAPGTTPYPLSPTPQIRAADR